MKLELTPAALALVGLILGLFVHDLTRLKRQPRLMLLEGIVFASGALLIVVPDIARRMARAVGIGRGVDFVLYPLVIWLVREALLTRRRRREEDERFTELVRAMAIEGARTVERPRADEKRDDRSQRDT